MKSSGQLSVLSLGPSVSVAFRTRSESDKRRTTKAGVRTENWQLGTGNWQLFSRRFLLWRVPQGVALDEAVEIFGEIGRVVAGALERLRH